MTVTELEKEVRDLKRGVDLAETRLAQGDGRFEFITGQLRDVQPYLHSRFGDIDGRLDKIDGRLDKIDGRLDKIDAKIDVLPRVIAELEVKVDRHIGTIASKIDALPRVIAELITKRG